MLKEEQIYGGQIYGIHGTNGINSLAGANNIEIKFEKLEPNLADVRLVLKDKLTDNDKMLLNKANSLVLVINESYYKLKFQIITHPLVDEILKFKCLLFDLENTLTIKPVG